MRHRITQAIAAHTNFTSALGAAGTFWLYAAICACGSIVILLRVTETKGKTLEQIERELVD